MMDFDPVFSGEPDADRILDQYNALTKATRSRNIIELQELLHKDAPVNHHLSNCYNLTPLHLAVQSRSLEIAKILLDKGADMNAKNMLGETPLILAAKTENIPLIDILLSYNVCNQEDNNQFSHLHIACMRNRVDTVRQLLSRNQGKDLNKSVSDSSTFWKGYTPLHFAVRYGCIETIEYLLECEADMMVQDFNSLTPLHLADLQRNEDVIDLLLSAHKSEYRNPSSQQGITHFHIACTRNNRSIVEHFLKSGVDVNLDVDVSSWRGWKPIHFAMYYECPEVVELLLETRVNLEDALFSKLLKHRHRMGCSIVYKKSKSLMDTTSEKNGIKSPFRTFCTQHLEMQPWSIGILLSSSRFGPPSDYNIPNWTGSTILHLAVKQESRAVIKYLLDHGADPMIQDSNCRTSLHIAFRSRFREILLLIVEKLSNGMPNMVDKEGLSIFQIMCTTNNLVIIQNFLDSGVDINAQVSDVSKFWAGFTSLHFACMYLQPEVVKVLLENHADIQITNRLNSNPFDFCVDRMSTDLPSNHVKYFDVLCKILLYLSSHVDQTLDTRGISSLHALCCSQDDESSSLLQQFLGIHSDKVNNSIELHQKHPFNGFTPLHLAIKFGNLDKAELMLEHGADPLLVNCEGKTALEYAHFDGLDNNALNKQAKTLFSSKIVNQTSRPSHFHMACCLGYLQTLKDVLKVSDEKTKETLMRCRNDDGQTPLHSMIAKRIPYTKVSRMDRMELLLDNGAYVDAQDYQLRTPLHYAHLFGDPEVIKLLVDFRADVNARDLYGNTPLHYFFRTNNKKGVALLLEFGADINMKDKKGQTCFTKKFPNISGESPIFVHRHYDRTEKKCVVIMLKHMKKLELIGRHFSEENLRAYAHAKSRFSTIFDEAAFIDDCGKELELMKTKYIDPYTSVRDILIKSPNKMAYHCKNRRMVEMLRSNEFWKKHPLYGHLFALQFSVGEVRHWLLSESKKVLSFLDGNLLPHICLEMVLEYLSDADLKYLIRDAE